MGFWIAALAAAALTALWVAKPLTVARRTAAPRAAHDAQVFRDQLAEVDRDLERGVLSADEARSARIEISRRLLAADAEAQATAAHRPAPRWASMLLAAAIVAAAPMGALWLHDRIGAPDLPDLPASARAEGFRPGQSVAEGRLGEAPPPPPADAAEALALLTELEKRVAGPNPDREGVFLLARSQSQLGRWADAWRSYAKLIELSGGDAPSPVYTAMAESMILAAGGYVSPEAEAALTAALQRDSANPVARFYMGEAFSQTGRPQSALETWAGLLRDSPADAPWRAQTIELIDRVVERTGLTRPEIPEAAPVSPEQQREQMLGAIRGLDERLTANGGGPMEWVQLVRSYSALDMAAEAADAEVRARAALAGRPEALAAFEAGMAATAGTPREAPAGGEPAARGPSAEDVAAAGAMSEADRSTMIRGMVGGLRDRLYADGGPAEQWAQLIRSLGVLGDREGAAEAAAKAREAHAADAAALSMIDETARQAGATAP